MVICLERGADLHMAQVMPLPLTVSCFSKIQIGFTFLVPAHPGCPGQLTQVVPDKGPLNGVCLLFQILLCCKFSKKIMHVHATHYMTTTKYQGKVTLTDKMTTTTTTLHSFNGLFSKTTWISRYQKGKTSLDLNEARDDGILKCNDISWTIGKHPHLTPNRQPHQHLITQFLQAGCSS